MTGKMTGRAVFFDIDGTLWDNKNRIADSTKEAVRALRENGHLVFLCSGRSRSYIREPELLGMDFDGIIGGCGTMIEYRGETIFYKKLEPTLLEYTLRTVRKYGFRPILEGKEYLYMDEEEFGPDDPFGQKLRTELGGCLLSISGNWGKWEASKLACATESADRETCLKILKDEYDFMIHNDAVLEMIPKGYHKGTGIIHICDWLGIDTADTVAFGDSANDVGMLHTAGIGIAMGSGSDEAKEAADYVTAGLYEDGIWKACRHFGLI